MIRCFLIAAFLLVSQASVANTLFCTHGNTTIQTGDTMDQVKAACGEPLKEQSSEKTDAKRIVMEQWFYTSSPYRPNYRPTPQLIVPKLTSSLHQKRGVLLSFLHGNLVEISRSGQKVSRATCGPYGQPISVGMTMDQVTQVCGQADYYSEAQSFTKPPKHLIVRWTYDNGPYQAQNILIFQNGILQSIK